MLLNIGSNAAKFTERGSVTLTAKLLDAPTLAAEGRVSVLLTCVDTGIGIPPGDISRVFERYSKVERDDGHAGGAGGTRTTGSLGLGLYLCRLLVEHLGGRIWIESTRAVGTTVFIELPPLRADDEGASTPAAAAPPAVASAQPACPRPAPPPTKLRVLVVDDYPFNLKIARALLEADGHVVATATNGSEALQAVVDSRAGDGAQRFDACLMDVNMPIKDGLQATREIRQLETRAGTPHSKPLHIIGLTASAGMMTGDVAQSCREAGMDHYLEKPLNVKALRQWLATVSEQPATSADHAAMGTGVGTAPAASPEPSPVRAAPTLLAEGDAGGHV